MRSALEIIRLLCGLTVLYIVVGCMIGFVLPETDPQAAQCFPAETTFGVFVWRCASGGADLFWSTVVGWPRFAIVPPAMAFALAKSLVGHHFSPISYAFFQANVGPFALLSLPLVIVLLVSFAHWKKRSRLLAYGSTAALLAEIVYVGWRA